MKKSLCKALIMLSKYFAIGFLVQFFVFSTLLGKDVNAQLSAPISKNLEDVTVGEVLNILSESAHISFVFDAKDIDMNKSISIPKESKKGSEILKTLSEVLHLSYKKIGNTITLKKKLKKTTLAVLPPMTEPANFKMNEPVGYIGHFLEAFTISGTVTDSTGSPLVGVTVQVKGTSKGTVTDANGHYEIVADEDATLVFSYVGYLDKEIAVGGNSNINVTMNAGATGLNELVVVGYGVQKKGDVTGAVSTVDVNRILGNRPVGTMSNLMQNVVPGLNVDVPSGKPGASTSWNIRGATDINASGNSFKANGPLILVDNVPFDGPLNLINPNDIASVTVLKDAGSAAIYGGRSAFGVILITTKEGEKNQKPRFSYSNNITFVKATNLPEKASPEDFLQGQSDMGTKTAWSGQNILTWKHLYDSLKNISVPYGLFKRGGILYPVHKNDPLKDLLGGSAFQIQNNFSVSGGGGKTTYRLSFNQTKKNGIMDQASGKDFFKRYTVASNLSSDVYKWVTLQLHTNYYHSTTSSPANRGRIYYEATTFPSLYSIADSVPLGGGKMGINGTPKNVASMTGSDLSKQSDVRLTGRVIFKPVKGLRVTGEYTYDNTETNKNTFDPILSVIQPMAFNPINFGSGNYTLDKQNHVHRTLNVFANYKRQFGSHNLSVMLGYNQESNEISGSHIFRDGMIVDDQPSLSNGTGPLNASDRYSAYAVAGYFGRINYNFEGKYFIQVNGRYDGSSKFPAGNRFGFFPSGSVGWRMSEEGFMQDLKPVFSNLKIRASYGNVGNQAIPPYSFIPTISSVHPSWLHGTGGLLNSLSSPGLISSSFTWETVSTLDIGVDFGFFANRLTGSFDWYQRETKDILAPGAVPLPAVLGTGAPLQNTASIESKGFEIELTYRDKITEDLSLRFSANVSNNVGKVTRFDGNPTNILSHYYVGQKVGEIWGYTTQGLFSKDDFEKGSLNLNLMNGTLKKGIAPFQGENPNPGDVRYKDLDGDGVVFNGENTLDNSGDMRVIGNNHPQYRFGLNGSITYKAFTFSFVTAGVGKQDLWIANPFTFPNLNQFATIYANELDYWTPENTTAHFGRIYDQAAGNTGFNEKVQTRFLKNGAYFRIRNLTLDYALPTHFIRKASLSSFHVFISVENPFLFDHLPKGLAPDLTQQNGLGMQYPLLRKTSFGVNITF